MSKTFSTIYRIVDRYRILPKSSDNVYIVLAFLSYRVLSTDIMKFINKWMNNNGHYNIDYMTISDKKADSFKEDIISETGLFIYPSQLFDNYYLTYHKDILGDIADIFDTVHCPELYRMPIQIIAKKLKEYSQNPIMTVAWNEQAFRNEKAYELLNFMADSSIRIDNDLFDDLANRRSEMLGSWTDCYTPSFLAKLMVKLVTCDNTNYKTIYNPYCAYGSLMIQFYNILTEKFSLNPDDLEESFNRLRFWGTNKQENALDLCWMNLIINRFHMNQFILKNADPLIGDAFTSSDKFDIIISSYSKDLSIVDHILNHLNNDSVAAILTFPGVLYRNGPDKEIRNELISKNLISAIIRLPSTLPGNRIAPCILILSNKPKENNGVLFINATEECATEGSRNIISDENIKRIVELFSHPQNIPGLSKYVSREEIIENENSLNVSSYIKPEYTIESNHHSNGSRNWNRTYKFNNSTLTIQFGDITKSEAEVIVSSDDTEISMGGGVSQSIFYAGGEFVKEDAQKKLPALLGDVIVSTAGKLAKQKYIFHCLTIDYNHNMDFYESKLSGRMTMNEYIARHCVGECLRLMQALNLTSIAFPLIGTGIAGIDMNMVAKIMSEALAEHISHTNMPYQIELFLMDRFGKKEKIDYQRVIEYFSLQEMLMERDNKNKYEEEDDSSSEPFLPNMNEEYPVFISFSDKDWDIVKKQILQVLNKEGIECFAYKKENYAGSRYKREIMDAIEKAQIVIFVSTKNSNRSREVEKEIGNSDRLGKKIIPVRFDDTPYSKDLAYDLNLIDYIDMNRMSNATQKLIEKVKFEIKRRPPLKE